MLGGLLSQLLCVLLVAGVASWAQQDSGLGYPPQFFYLAPSDAAIVLASHDPNKTPPKTSNKALPVDVDEGETAQFHSQDGKGRAVFGYLLPDQSRVEERAQDGTVRGAYSYLDPTGKAVKVQYWDTGSGFHAAGNNLPGISLGLPEAVKDTAEVQNAREEHWKQVLQLFLQHLQPDQAEKAKPASTVTQHLDSVVVESDEHGDTQDEDDDELKRYPNLDNFPQNLFDPTHMHDENREAVIVDSLDGAEIANNNLRSGKSSKLEEKETEKSQTVSNTTEEKSPENKNENPPETHASYGNDTDKMIDSSVPQSREGRQESSDELIQTSDVDQRKPSPAGSRGYFYSIQQPIPLFVQVQTIVDGQDSGKATGILQNINSEPLSHSQQAVYFGAQPVAAVHDFQVPLWQKDAFKSSLLLPLFSDPFINQRAKANNPLTYSQKAAYFGAIPIAAVHDQQAHFNQRGSFSDHQTLPVYIEPSVEANK